jgi:hypothetical protein
MRLIVNIPDNKAAFFMEVLKNFSFVKATPISATKADHLEDFKQAVEEVKLAKDGKIKLQSAKDLLDEL